MAFRNNLMELKKKILQNYWLQRLIYRRLLYKFTCNKNMKLLYEAQLILES